MSDPLFIKKHEEQPPAHDVLAAINTFKAEFRHVPGLEQLSDAEIQRRVDTFLDDKRVITVNQASLYTDSMVAVSPCTEAVATVIVDVIFMGLGFVGLHVSANEAANRAVVRLLGGSTLNGFQRLIHNLTTAGSATAKAKAIFEILSAAYSAGMIRAVFAEIKDSMSWWDWVITGVAAVAQIAALVLTDGAAFIAEVALNGTAIAYVVSDSVKAANACG